MNKRGVVFLVDMLVAITFIFVLVAFLLTIRTQGDYGISQEVRLTNSLFGALEQSTALEGAIEGDTNELAYFLNESIPLPFCMQVRLYNFADTLIENVTQSDCNLTTQDKRQRFGTKIVDDAFYIMEVSVWRK